MDDKLAEEGEILDQFLKDQEFEEVYETAYYIGMDLAQNGTISVSNETSLDMLACKVQKVCAEQKKTDEEFIRETVLLLAKSPPPKETKKEVIDIEEDDDNEMRDVEPSVGPSSSSRWSSLFSKSSLVPKESSNISPIDLSEESRDGLDELEIVARTTSSTGFSEDSRDEFDESEIAGEEILNVETGSEERWAGLSDDQKRALRLILIDKKNILVTGPAGTGKSHLLRVLVSELIRLEKKKSIAVTGTTGVSAMNVLGCTVHSFAGIGLGKDCADKLVRNIKDRKMDYKWTGTETWIIDEISMLSADLLEKLDYIGRHLRKNMSNSSRPFGGIQMVFFGDFFQLPPVKDNEQKEKDKKMEEEGKGKAMDFCFESTVWRDLIDEVVELNQSFRQNDPTLFGILNRIREGIVRPEDMKTLRTRVTDKPLPVIEGVEVSRLFSRNKDVDDLNEKKINELKGEPRVFTAVIKFFTSGKKKVGRTKEQAIASRLKDHPPAPHSLKLKVGAQVMLTYNLDVRGGFVNGSRGVVTGFENSKDTVIPTVRFSNGKEMEIDYKEWKFEDHMEGWALIFSNVPLRLAWAVSIHKSQGLTITKLGIDIGSSIFAYGQAYVALSRCSDLSGLWITKFDSNKINADPKVKRFYQCVREGIPYAPIEMKQPSQPDKRAALTSSSEGILGKRPLPWDPKRWLKNKDVKTDSLIDRLRAVA